MIRRGVLWRFSGKVIGTIPLRDQSTGSTGSSTGTPGAQARVCWGGTPQPLGARYRGLVAWAPVALAVLRRAKRCELPGSLAGVSGRGKGETSRWFHPKAKRLPSRNQKGTQIRKGVGFAYTQVSVVFFVCNGCLEGLPAQTRGLSPLLVSLCAPERGEQSRRALLEALRLSPGLLKRSKHFALPFETSCFFHQNKV